MSKYWLMIMMVMIMIMLIILCDSWTWHNSSTTNWHFIKINGNVWSLFFYFHLLIFVVDASSTSFSTHQFIYYLFIFCSTDLELYSTRTFGRLLSFYLSFIPWLLFCSIIYLHVSFLVFFVSICIIVFLLLLSSLSSVSLLLLS